MTIQIDFATELPPANEPAKKTRTRAPRAPRARRASRSCEWSSYVDENGNVHHDSMPREW